MAAARAAWKGYLKLGSVSCAVKVIGAATESGKIHFRILNRKNREPVKSVYVDEETGEVVETEDQVKGYGQSGGEFLEIEPDDIKRLKPVSQHTLDVEGFVDLDDIDRRYLEKPYYLIPADGAAEEPFAVIREAMKRKKVAARSCIVLYQRGRGVLIQPCGKGMVMTELRNDGEVISEKSVFGDLKEGKADAEMIEIAELLIDKKQGKFDPSTFKDTYEDALVEMIRAKQKGKKPPKPVPPPKDNVVDLASVLRKSLEKEGIKPKKAAARKTTGRKTAGRKRKAA